MVDDGDRAEFWHLCVNSEWTAPADGSTDAVSSFRAFAEAFRAEQRELARLAEAQGPQLPRPETAAELEAREREADAWNDDTFGGVPGEGVEGLGSFFSGPVSVSVSGLADGQKPLRSFRLPAQRKQLVLLHFRRICDSAPGLDAVLRRS